MSNINSGTILLLFLAIICGLGGTYFLRKSQEPKPVIVSQEPTPIAKPPAKMTVPMASRNLMAGHQVALDDIALVKMTREEVKAHGLKTAFMTNPSQIIGKTLKDPIQRGHTFDTRSFYPLGSGPGISSRIQPGFRAITISLTPVNALIGFAGAGQNVDILFHYGEVDDSVDPAGSLTPSQDRLTFDAGRRNPTTADPTGFKNRQYYGQLNGDLPGSVTHKQLKNATKTLVQNAEILAVNNRALPTSDSHGISMEERVLVTLSVLPNDAELLRVAAGHGELSLTLRSESDEAEIRVANAAQINDIIPAPSVSQPPPIRTMEVYRGQKVSHLQFDQANGVSQRIVDSPRAYRPEHQQPYDPRIDYPWSPAFQNSSTPGHPIPAATRQSHSEPLEKPDALAEPIVAPLQSTTDKFEERSWPGTIELSSPILGGR